MDLLAAGQKVWRFEGGEPWMNTPEPVKAAMGAALARNQTRYAPSSGIPELRSAILEKVRTRNGIPADAESPIVVSGGMHGLFAAFATLLDPGDEVLMFSPYWTPIVDLVGYHQATAVLVPTVEARREGLSAALAPRTTAEDEAPLLELAQQSDRRRLLPRRDRGGRGVRAASAGSPSCPTRRTRTSSTRASRRSRSRRCPGCSSARSPASRCPRATR